MYIIKHPDAKEIINHEYKEMSELSASPFSIYRDNKQGSVFEKGSNVLCVRNWARAVRHVRTSRFG